MSFTDTFIRRPVMTTLVMAGILGFGLFAFRSLPVSDLPNVDFPTIQVSAALPGASPETMASAVATPLEEQFTTIAGVGSMTPSRALWLAQPRSSQRRGRPGRAGDDRQGGAPAAAEHAHAAHLPEGEPGRPAGALPGPEL